MDRSDSNFSKGKEENNARPFSKIDHDYHPAENPFPAPNAYPPAYTYPAPNGYPIGNPYPAANPYLVPNPNKNEKIRDYLAWSISNLCCSFVITGIVAVILSILVRRRRRSGEYERAKTLSTITLVVNIIGTIIGIILWAYIIYVIVAASLLIGQSTNRTS